MTKIQIARNENPCYCDCPMYEKDLLGERCKAQNKPLGEAMQECGKVKIIMSNCGKCNQFECTFKGEMCVNKPEVKSEAA